MNGTAFGFTRPPQRPSLAPQQVGQMLMQRKMMQEPQQPAPVPGPSVPEYSDPMPMSQPMSAPIVGALLTQTPSAMKIGGDDFKPSALHIAESEAEVRAPGATQGTQRGPASPGSIAQLLRMGVSQAEIELLRLSGSVK